MTDPPSARAAARAVQAGMDVLVLVLAVVVLTRGGTAAVLAVAFGLVYGVGRLTVGRVVVAPPDHAAEAQPGVPAAGIPASRLAGRRRPGVRPVAVVWVAVLTAGALVAGAVATEGVWLAFPVFLLQLHVLPVRAGVAAVAVTTAATVAVGTGDAGPTTGAVLGPVIGAAVCVAAVLGVRAVITESGRREALMEALVAARSELAGRERVEAVAAERDRLAREIHDTLAQGLASIELVLRAADAGLAAARPELARELVATARTAARDNLAEARAFVRDLPSPSLSDGLPGALRTLAAATTVRTGVPVAVTVSGTEERLPDDVAQALWRVAQQALANAGEHARAGQVAVTVSYLGDAVALDVVDDGAGFDAAAATSAGPTDEMTVTGRGAGLAGMAARVRAVGGTLEIESAPGAGTAVAVAVPL